MLFDATGRKILLELLNHSITGILVQKYHIRKDRYKKMVVGDGFEPSKSATADLQSAPFGRSGTPPLDIGAGEGNRTLTISLEG